MSPPMPFALKRENSFSTCSEVQSGHAIVVPELETSSSNRWLQDRQAYS